MIAVMFRYVCAAYYVTTQHNYVLLGINRNKSADNSSNACTNFNQLKEIDLPNLVSRSLNILCGFEKKQTAANPSSTLPTISINWPTHQKCLPYIPVATDWLWFIDKHPQSHANLAMVTYMLRDCLLWTANYSRDHRSYLHQAHLS